MKNLQIFIIFLIFYLTLEEVKKENRNNFKFI